MGLLGTWANSSYEANSGTDLCSGLADLASGPVLSWGVAVCVLCLTTFGEPHCQQCAYLSSMPVPQLLQRHITAADIMLSARRVKIVSGLLSRRTSGRLMEPSERGTSAKWME